MTLLLDAATRAAWLLDPETAHNLAIAGMEMLGPAGAGGAAPRYDALATQVAGLSLPNPIGLAAGFDKDARVPDAMLAAGFGFAECGTVTPLPQPGNPRPRVFRLRADAGVINRYGFNSGGLDAFTQRLSSRLAAPGKRRGVVGANLGANKDSPDRIEDYALGLRATASLVDYVTINISSPNTPGLRGLQEAGALEDLLGRIETERAALDAKVPVFLKVAPDLDDVQIAAIAAAAERYSLDALIVSNTTLARPELLKSRAKGEAGGLSGRPLFAPSTVLVSQFRAATGGRLPLIGAGGVEDGETAFAKIRAGASAVQLYTALAYKGPGLVRVIARDLAARLAADGFASVAEAVGVDAPL